MKDFNEYFQGVYGEEWPHLQEALLQSKRKVALLNPLNLSPVELYHAQFEGARLAVAEIDSAPDSYQMDLASVYPSLLLEVKRGDRVLDMCAAPGGKSLALIYQMMEGANFTLSEVSQARSKRLASVMDVHLPSEVRSRIDIKTVDANKWGLFAKEKFNKVLLDAPCSGERHALEKGIEKTEWTYKKSQKLAQRQYSLLCSALLSCKSGGRVVYSTCSINPMENDQVVEKALKKKKGGRPRVLNLEIGEPTEWGWQILPHKCEGWGPIYMSVLDKTC